MEAIAYLSPTVTAEFVRNATGVLQLRIRQPYQDPRDHDPKDLLQSGILAAELAIATYPLQSATAQACTREFCGSWPGGPQPTDTDT